MTYPSPKPKNEIHTMIVSLVWILSVSFLLSFFAKLFWVFDYFSHFMMQYFVGGIILCALLLVIRQYKYAVLALCIALLSFVESRRVLQDPFQFFSPLQTESMIEGALFKIVQYNHNFGKQDFRDVEAWLKRNVSNYDVVVFQEASDQTVKLLQSLKDIYPYQIHESRNHPFGMAIISKNQIIDHDVIPLGKSVFNNFALRFSINLPDQEEPLVLYALHAVPPVGSFYFQQRNFEILELAHKIKEDSSNFIAFVGDWNITPYSPYFSELKEISGLKYQAFGLFLNPTWASFHYLQFLKIPIDHVLHSDSLVLLDKEVGKSFGSDHHSLIVTLGIPK